MVLNLGRLIVFEFCSRVNVIFPRFLFSSYSFLPILFFFLSLMPSLFPSYSFVSTYCFYNRLDQQNDHNRLSKRHRKSGLHKQGKYLLHSHMCVRIIPKHAPIVVDLPVIGRILDIYSPTTSYDEVFNNSKSLLFIY
jgi:hypothetical protein